MDTVLRRYIAGYALLGSFVMREAEADETLLQGTTLQRVLRAQAALLDHLIAAITDEHTRASQAVADSPSLERRRADLVKGLLAGELFDSKDLAYDLSGHHLGLFAAGPGAEQAIREIAAALDRRLLLIRPSPSTVWAWLGGRRCLGASAVTRLVSSSRQEVVSLALGEPGAGLAGWRLTHRQAAAAWVIAERDSRSILRYADVALLASALRDEVLVTSLRLLYLSPLDTRRNGATLRQTLRTFFSTGRSITSTAASLQVTRQTVRTRLHAVEELIDRSLDECAVEMEIALGIDAIQGSGTHVGTGDFSFGPASSVN